MPNQLASFRAWCDEVGGTGAAARLLGCSAPTISLIYHGDRKPGRALAAKIERAAGILPRANELAPAWIRKVPAGGWDPE